MNKELKGTFIAVLAAGSYALNPILAQFAYEDQVNTLTLSTIRFTLAALIIWALLFATKRNLRARPRAVLSIIAFGVLGMGASSFAFYQSIKLIPISVSVLILYIYPLLVTFFSICLGLERISWQKILALCFSLGGLYLVLASSFQDIEIGGILMALLAAFLFAFYMIGSSRVLKQMDNLLMTAYVATANAFTFAVISLFAGELNFSFGTQGWLASGGAAVFPTVIALYLLYRAMSYIGPSKTSIICTLEPMLTVYLAVLLFNEALVAKQLWGGFLILFGVLILQINFSKKLADKTSGDSLADVQYQKNSQGNTHILEDRKENANY